MGRRVRRPRARPQRRLRFLVAHFLHAEYRLRGAVADAFDHITSNSCIPSRLYTIFGSSCA